ncbi:Propanediol utilisation/coumermycin biosynthesis, PduX-related like protein, partial [Aduncisulcus paluster]
FYGGPELLVSYAIDCYSSVTLELSSHFELSINHENEKALEAFYKACAYFGLDRSKLKLDICSDIPVGKGMASSTADIVGVLTAVAVFAGKEPDPNWLGKAAAEIEPTDNIMFEDWV